MLTGNEFIVLSMDLNLFFLRIMKEHSFFLEIAFAPKDSGFASEARDFRQGFEKLLIKATDLANGNVSEKAVMSNQFVTKYTADAEKLSGYYTGIPFDLNLTQKEQRLKAGDRHQSMIERAVDALNRSAYTMTAALVDFKDKIHKNVLACRMFTLNYPLLIEHIIREAKLYLQMLSALNDRNADMSPEYLISQEIFWNRQMAEHAKFIAGLLDPTEETLIDAARAFGKEFDRLTEDAKQVTHSALDIAEITSNTIPAMESLRDFKTAGTEGLLDCKIKSIIIPLLADHVLREANHYLCILGECNAN